MKFKESITDWVMPALLLTPHMVLLVAIWIEVNNPNNFQSIETVITLLGVIVGAFGVWIAWQGLYTWKKSLTKPMELDIDLITEIQVRKIQAQTNSYVLFVNNDLYYQCLHIKHCKDNNEDLPTLPMATIENINSAEIMKNAYKLSNLRTTVSVKKRTHPSRSDAEDIIELCKILTIGTNKLEYYIKNPQLINGDWHTKTIENLTQKQFPNGIYLNSIIENGEVINKINSICDKCVKELHEKWNS